MGDRPRMLGDLKDNRPVRADKLWLSQSVSAAWAHRGVAFITVLIAVSFVSIIVIACITLVTMAARTTSWSVERTKALYAAEAGINHWLFEASIEESGAPHQHGRRHGDGHAGRGCGHTHRQGAGHGSGLHGGQGSGQSGSRVESLEVSGEINGISYTASAASTSEPGTYRVTSVARTSSRTAVGSVVVTASPEAWRHVIYAQADSWVLSLLRLFGCLVNDPLQWVPASGEHEEVWVRNAKDVPTPIWYRDGRGYWPAVALKLYDWSPPLDREQRDLTEAGILSLQGDGPFYLVNCDIGTIDASIDGDLYLLNCKVRKLTGRVGGDVLIRVVKSEGGKSGGAKNPLVHQITGQIGGSICIDYHEGYNDPVVTTIGDSNATTTVGGAVYLRGRRPGNSGVIRGGLVILGPPVSAESTGTSIGGGVFTEDGWLFIDGRVDISHVSQWPAILSTSCVILSGMSSSVHVDGIVYSEAESPISLAGNADGLLGALRISNEQGLGVVIVGSNWKSAGTPCVVVDGNVVSPGAVILVGNVSVNYRRQSVPDPPPFFENGRKLLTRVAGTWSVNWGSATQQE